MNCPVDLSEFRFGLLRQTSRCLFGFLVGVSVEASGRFLTSDCCADERCRECAANQTTGSGLPSFAVRRPLGEPAMTEISALIRRASLSVRNPSRRHCCSSEQEVFSWRPIQIWNGRGRKELRCQPAQTKRDN